MFNKMKKNKKDKTDFERILDEIEGKDEFHNFDGEDYGYEEYYEEYENMEGKPVNRKKLYRANPYQIIIQNTTDKPLKAILFGNDKFLLKPNFGSDRGIIIGTGQSGVEYVELLQRSSTKQFKTQHIRIESDNILQLSKPMTIHKKDGAGVWQQTPLNLHIYRSPYQNSEKIIDVDDVEIALDGSTYFEVEIEPKTRIFYSIFPLYAIDTADTLKGRDPIKSYAPARVNTGAVSIRPKYTPRLPFKK